MITILIQILIIINTHRHRTKHFHWQQCCNGEDKNRKAHEVIAIIIIIGLVYVYRRKLIADEIENLIFR